MSKFKRPPVDSWDVEVRRRAQARMSYSSLDCGSKLRCPSPKALEISDVVSNPLGVGKPTPRPFDISVQECHKPGLDLQTTVPGKCSSSPEDEQEKQGQVKKDFTPCTKVIPRRMAQDRGTGVREITAPPPIPASSSAASFPGTPTCDGSHWRHTCSL
ncbi:hypothetical protein TNCV_1546511 [Trichonephila clavipes]|nr:hypothetical protein TNCV_1546511 [Trichonephila clavipes]